MRNSHGLDARYFKNKLSELVRDVDNYAPSEMARALQRLASVATFQRTAEEWAGKPKLPE